MKAALNDAGLEPKDIQYINSHGTSTPVGDIAEINAVCKVFGEYATNGLMVSSTKSMHGHLLGASGGVESVACIRAMQEGIIPPTVNIENVDERVPQGLNLVLDNPIKLDDLNSTMSNSFGFGGHNASLIFKKLED